MVGGKLFRTLVLGGIAAAGCGSARGARSDGRGGTTVDAATGGADGGGLGGGSESTGGAAGDIAGRGGTGGTGGAGGNGGAGGDGGAGGNADASVIPDATIVDGAVCCPPECEGHQCACAGGACCWLVAPGSIPGCAKACFPRG
jgi:hypothetical protein